MYSKEYEKQVRLLLQCLPLLEEVDRFCFKKRTAINFLKNMPRLSVILINLFADRIEKNFCKYAK